jgi:hypothetical protein
VSYTCPRRGCEGFWTPDPDAMAAHRDAHPPVDDASTLARAGRTLIVSALFAWAGIVLLVLGFVVWFLATGQTLS